MNAWDFLLIALFALQIADAVTTKRVLERGGRELNPVVRWLIEKLGVTGGLAAKVIFASGCCLLLWSAAQAGSWFAKVFMIAVTALGLIVVAGNHFGWWGNDNA